MQTIIDYLVTKYHPKAIIVYGSYADGSVSLNSDFDALLISEDIKTHDSSTVNGIELDVWVYPESTFQSDFDPKDFIQIFDGDIVLDPSGKATALQTYILEYLASVPQKSEEEINQGISWCEKMVARTKRGDVEGFYRWHWVLTDSLEIFCDVKKIHYYGPKKAISKMMKEFPEAYSLYKNALESFNGGALEEWVAYLRKCASKCGKHKIS